MAGGPGAAEGRAALAELDRLLAEAEAALHRLQRAADAGQRRAAERQLQAALEVFSERLEALSGCSAAFRNAVAAGLAADAFRAVRVRTILEAVEAMEVQRRSLSSAPVSEPSELEGGEPDEPVSGAWHEAAGSWGADGLARGTPGRVLERAARPCPFSSSDSRHTGGGGASVGCDANFSLDGVARGNVLQQAMDAGCAGRCVDLCGVVAAQLEELGTGEAPSSLTDVYEGDWSAMPEYGVRVEVLAAFGLAAPEYRFGDLTKDFLGGQGARLGSVYVQAQVGPHVSRTATASAGPERHACYSGERMLFSYSSESELVLTVRDQRGLQSTIRGDPLIGEARLPLQDLPRDAGPQEREVRIKRDGKETGVVSLRFQMLSLSGGVAVPRAASDFSTSAPGGSAPGTMQSQPQGENEVFTTPPNSPREAA